MMPSKKKKYNARFPAGRIKRIMQTDEDVGKVAQAVPVIISRALELFVESFLTKTMEITSARNARTLTPSHMKQCILSEHRFEFLKELVTNVADVTPGSEDECLSGVGGPVVEGGGSRARGTAGRGRPPGKTRRRNSDVALQSSTASRPPVIVHTNHKRVKVDSGDEEEEDEDNKQGENGFVMKGEQEQQEQPPPLLIDDDYDN